MSKKSPLPTYGQVYRCVVLIKIDDLLQNNSIFFNQDTPIYQGIPFTNRISGPVEAARLWSSPQIF